MVLHSSQKTTEPTDDLILFIRSQIRRYENKIGYQESDGDITRIDEEKTEALKIHFMALCACN
jgi:hypothetical protein